MKKFSKKIVVTESEWKERLDSYSARELRELEVESLRDEPFEEFFKSGNLENFINNCIVEGSDPLRGWIYIFTCNPNRDFELLKNNIKLFWDWVLEDGGEHLSKIPVDKGEDRKTSIFEIGIDTLGTVNSLVLDPVCAAKLFLWVYGEEFEPVRSFPVSFGRGKNEWTPQIEVNAVERFADMAALFGSYLFDGDDDVDITDRQSLALVDYWFSIIPHLNDLRIFDTEMHVDLKLEYPRRQSVVRAFFARLSGYDVYQEYDELPHNDPEMERYIKNRLAETEMPDSYCRLLEYIEEHKEKSCDNLDEDEYEYEDEDEDEDEDD
jgi:hypothetical protein